MKKNKAKNEEIKDGKIIEDKGEISTSSANTNPERNFTAVADALSANTIETSQTKEWNRTPQTATLLLAVQKTRTAAEDDNNVNSATNTIDAKEDTNIEKRVNTDIAQLTNTDTTEHNQAEIDNIKNNQHNPDPADLMVERDTPNKPTDINTNTQEKSHTEQTKTVDDTKIEMFVGHISTETTKEDLMELFGYNSTAYLRQNVRIKLVFNARCKFVGCAA